MKKTYVSSAFIKDGWNVAVQSGSAESFAGNFSFVIMSCAQRVGDAVYAEERADGVRPDRGHLVVLAAQDLQLQG